MARHLILTVHGIGEQTPGETVDQVLGAAITSFVEEQEDSARYEKAEKRVRVENEVIRLPETPFDGKPRKPRFFDVHLRRVTNLNANEDQALFADVYWADRSPAPKAGVRTILDLLWVLLGLGYLAMDNAEEVHGRWCGFFVHAFAWIFFAGIAAMNALLFLGSIALMTQVLPIAEEYILPVLRWVLVATYLLATAFGLYFASRAETFLQRVFWRGFYGFAIFSTGVVLASPMGLGGFSCKDGVEPMECLIQVKLGILGGLWVLAVFLTVFIGILSLFWPNRNHHDSLPGARVIYAQICAAMVVFWMIFTAALWLAFRQLIQQVPLFDNTLLEKALTDQLGMAVQSLSAAVVGFLILFVWGCVLVGLRKAFASRLHTKCDFLKRAILNPIAGYILLFSAVIVGAAVFRRLVQTTSEYDPLCAVAANGINDECYWPGRALNFLANYDGQIMLGVLGLGVLIYRYASNLSGALGVARDIVTYAVRGRCYLWADQGDRMKNYPQRKAINLRFLRVIQYCCTNFQPTRVTIISHSQGTVIATRMLLDTESSVQEALGKRPVTLVTMGAPVTHIYQQYFPESFHLDGEKIKVCKWYNIFREDDFVGTKIDKQTGHVINLAVAPGGHIGYFTDHKVWSHLWRRVKFELF